MVSYFLRGVRSSVGANSRRRPARQRFALEQLEPRQLFAADAVLEWNELLLDAVRADKTAPPPASRAMAIVHLAIYDAVNSIDGSHSPYLVDKKGPKGASPEAAAAQAGHDALTALYPQYADQFHAALVAMLDNVPDGAAQNQGVEIGRYAAQKVLKARKNDGAELSVPYAPGGDPGDWRPTPPAFADSLFPQWPMVTPFAMTSAEQFRPDGPPPLDSAAYAEAVEEVQELGGDGVVTPTSRNSEQTLIAKFWADGAGTETPPGHWNTIARNVALDRGATLAENARLFALLNLALADAAIAAWDAKYEFDFWRPVTAIRLADSDGNDATLQDASWTPLLVTPPFPAYVSGHSTFSSAAAALLANYFGADAVAFSTGSDVLPGVTRSFASFSAAAEEAGQSRIYGGIHFQFDNVDGQQIGGELGNYVFTHYLTPITQGAARTAPAAIAAESAQSPTASHLAASYLDASRLVVQAGDPYVTAPRLSVDGPAATPTRSALPAPLTAHQKATGDDCPSAAVTGELAPRLAEPIAPGVATETRR